MCDICWIVSVKGSVENSQSVALCVTVVTHRNFSTYTSVICHIGSEDELDQYHTTSVLSFSKLQWMHLHWEREIHILIIPRCDRDLQ